MHPMCWDPVDVLDGESSLLWLRSKLSGNDVVPILEAELAASVPGRNSTDARCKLQYRTILLKTTRVRCVI